MKRFLACQGMCYSRNASSKPFSSLHGCWTQPISGVDMDRGIDRKDTHIIQCMTIPSSKSVEVLETTLESDGLQQAGAARKQACRNMNVQGQQRHAAPLLSPTVRKARALPQNIISPVPGCTGLLLRRGGRIIRLCLGHVILSFGRDGLLAS